MVFQSEFHRYMADMERITPLLVQLDRLRKQMLDRNLVWIFPPGLFAGAVEVEGVKVVRLFVSEPLLAHTGAQ